MLSPALSIHNVYSEIDVMYSICRRAPATNLAVVPVILVWRSIMIVNSIGLNGHLVLVGFYWLFHCVWKVDCTDFTQRNPQLLSVFRFSDP